MGAAYLVSVVLATYAFSRWSQLGHDRELCGMVGLFWPLALPCILVIASVAWVAEAGYDARINARAKENKERSE